MSLQIQRDTTLIMAKNRQFSYHLVMQSSTALVRAWPRWSDPVTLGGGIHIINKPFGLGSWRLLRCLWWKCKQCYKVYKVSRWNLLSLISRCYVLIALVNSKSVKNEEQKRKFKTSKLCHFEFVAKKFIN